MLQDSLGGTVRLHWPANALGPLSRTRCTARQFQRPPSSSLPQARTVLVICCSPSLFNDAETLSSLRFGIRAKARMHGGAQALPQLLSAGYLGAGQS